MSSQRVRSLFLALLSALSTAHAQRPPARRNQVLPTLFVPFSLPSTNNLQRFLYGGVRLEREGNSIRVADNSTAESLQQAIELTHGWAFITEAGRVAIAPSFLGAMRIVGHVPTQRATFEARGRVVFYNEQEQLFSSDGSAPTALTPPNTDTSLLLGVVFADSNTGIALREGLAPLFTTDAGAHWSTHPSVRSVVLRAQATATGLTFETTEQTARFRNDGSVDRFFEAFSRSTAETPRETRALLDQEIYRRFPALASHYAVSQTTPQEGFALRRRQEWIVVDSNNGTVVQRITAPTGMGYHLFPWRNTFVLTLLGHGGEWFLQQYVNNRFVDLVTQPRPSFRFISDGDRNIPGLALSSDGQHLVYEGACPNETYDRTRAQLCARTQRNTWRAIALPSAEIANLSMTGPVLLLRSQEQLLTINVENARTQPVALPTLPPHSTLVRATFQQTADETMVLSVNNAEHREELTGVLLGTRLRFTLQPVPEHTGYVAFLDRQRGIALSSDRLHLWRTSDGGAHWTSFATFPTPVLSLNPLRCLRQRCIVEERLVLEDWNAGIESNEQVLTLPPTSAQNNVRPTVSNRTCRASSSNTEARAATTDALLFSQPTNDTTTLRLSWQGRDHQGTFRVPVGEPTTFTSTVENTQLRLLHASRRFALVERMQTYPGVFAHEILRIDAQTRQASALAFSQSTNTGTLPIFSVRDVLAEETGRLRLLLTFPRRNHTELDGLFTYEASGELQPPQYSLWNETTVRGIARYRQRWGHTSIGAQGVWFHPFDAALPERIVAALPSALSACAAAPSTEWLRLSWSETPQTMPIGPVLFNAVHLDVHDGSVCVRATRGTLWSTTTLTASEHGRLPEDLWEYRVENGVPRGTHTRAENSQHPFLHEAVQCP